MENKNTQNKNSISFEQLKKVSSILNGSELGSFASAIGKAKRALDAYCKTLKEKEANLKNSPKEVEKPVTADAPKTSVVSEKPASKPNIVFTPKNNTRPNYNNNYNRQNGDFRQQYGNSRYGNQGGYNNQNGNRQGFNRPNGDRPMGQRPQRPMGAVGSSQGGVRPLKPFTREEKDVLFVKPERELGNKNKTKQVNDEKKELSKKAKMRMGYVEVEDYETEDGMARIRSNKPKKQKETAVQEKIEITNAVITGDTLTVKELSEKIGKPAVELIKKFMMLGMMLNINSSIDFATAELVASEFGVTLEQKVEKNYEEKLEDMFAQNAAEANEKRPPIVTVMGHVDHGKTSLLDAIKKTNVTAGEAGGITQHIGAYSIEVNKNKITFIDTPGHEAFTAMRARGAQVTDIAILVVAADDGIMPQTIEAINHIKAAKVPMIVAINKMDKPEANPERVKQQLTEYDVVPEEWGGDTICVPISAITGKGIDKLLEMVLLVADMSELKANPKNPASGYVLESRVDKGRGVEVTVVVRDGTLKVGDFVISGTSYGKVKALNDYKGNAVKSAGPSMAVSVLGLNNVPEAGEKVYVVDEKMGKNIVEERVAKQQIEMITKTNNVTLEEFLSKSADNEVKTLNLIVKADVKGSAEALKASLEKIHNDEVVVKVIHSTVGAVNESDVLLAQSSGAIIIAFNVRPDSKAKVLAERNGVDIKYYRVIYDAIDDVTKAINGMLTPKFEEKVLGHAEVRHIFKISSVGTIAGSYVQDGVVSRGNKVRLLRSNVVIVETEIESLQQGKDDAKSIKAGFECGIKLKNYSDIKEGDIIEVYELQQI